MGVAYVNKTIVTTAAKTYRLAINVPPKGEIIRAQCRQVSGGKTAFTFSLFNSAASCPPDPLDVNGNPAPVTPAVTVDPFVEYAGQIGSDRAVTNTQDRYLNADGTDGGWLQIGLPYINADSGISTAQPRLYVKFVAGGAGTYEFFFTVKTDK